MTRSLALLALGAALLAAPGCVSCALDRDVELDRDLLPGDVATFAETAGARGGEVLDCSVGVPFLFLPVLGALDEGRADDVGGGRLHFHLERTRHVALVAYNRHETANFDERGRSLSYRRRWSAFLWALNGEESTRRAEDGGMERSSTHNVLWGLLAHRRTRGERTGGRFLLFPYGDDVE